MRDIALCYPRAYLINEFNPKQIFNSEVDTAHPSFISAVLQYSFHDAVV